jgi:2-keto-3-deoxy-L-rhamnonate aldolase RhmA
MRYPPEGVRGMARFTRAAGFGWEFDDYARRANAELLTVVQIETGHAVANAAAIAAVDGADVLFVGPTDLSTNLGVPLSWDEAEFRGALRQVVAACRNAGKAAGILLSSASQIDQAAADGFRFVALGSDGAMVAAGMKGAAQALVNHKAT